MRALLFSTIFLSLIGCTSALKKQCQETNWYQHAHSVALSGKRLSQDEFIKICEKEEVEINAVDLDVGFKSGMGKYCTADSALKTGKAGMTLSEDFCSSGELPSLRKKHSEGIAIYCSKEGLYEAGVQGNVYTGICSKELEAQNLSEFKRGRKKFLEFTVTQNKEKIREIDETLDKLTYQVSLAGRRLSALPYPRTQFNEQTKTTETIDPYSGERSTINSEIERINYKIRKLEKDRTSIKDATYKMEAEMITLN